MKLSAILTGRDPEPMTDQDLQDWGGDVDSRSGVGRGPGGRTSERDIAAGEAVLSVINARRGKS